MKDLRHNERGLTLIELLAALVISAVLLGTAAAFYASLQHVWKDEAQKYSDDSSIRHTVRAISRQLTESSQAVAFPNELRLKMGPGASPVAALVHDPSARTLTFYQFDDPTLFADPSVSISTHGALYLSAQLLSDRITSIAFTTPGADGIPVPVGSAPVGNGALISYTLTFETNRSTISGANRPDSQTIHGTAKLIYDYTSK